MGFIEFFHMMSPVTMPVLVMGLLTCMLLEKFCWFGYGAKLPAEVRTILEDFDAELQKQLIPKRKAQLFVQGLVAVFLVFGLAFHLAEVGLIGLTVIVLLTAFNGVIEEHQIGKAFEEALPLTALLVVLFIPNTCLHRSLPGFWIPITYQPMPSRVFSSW